jgi:predicted nucleic acid-binding protein
LNCYSDTSFLASLYRLDVNSTKASEEFRLARPVLLLTPFGELELVNAFESRVFRREVEPAEIRASLSALEADVHAGVIVRKAVPEAAYTRAIELSRRHTRRLGSRALDILHVAIALELRAEMFFTFDRRQSKLARRAGMTVRPRTW